MSIYKNTDYGSVSGKALRATSNDVCIANAIAAWERGEVGMALAWAGIGPDATDVLVAGREVYVRFSSAPSTGGSPRNVVYTSELGKCPVSCALAAHILAAHILAAHNL